MAVRAEQTLGNLVTQFSSALDFYRELVQNSIDAGSTHVDVWLEFLPDEKGDGADTIAIHIDDYGEGMDEEIIDNQLTTLFSSTKEDDLTKIGKFGIGFVSVFALRPKAVLIQTGRGGQWWEVLFYQDRSFSKSRLEVPVEGTQITLFIEGDRARYIELVHSSKKTLKRWCRFSDAEVTFEDRADPRSRGPEPINAPFGVDGLCATRVEHQGTEIALAYSDEPTYGFFNNGLTLAETSDVEDAFGKRSDRFEHIAVRVKSRYLEHTLSRETVLKDQNYDKAMALIEAAADNQLFSRLVYELTELAVVESLEGSKLSEYFKLLGLFTLEPPALIREHRRRPLLRTLHGKPLTPQDLHDVGHGEGRVFVTARRSRLTATVHEQGVPVFAGDLPGLGYYGKQGSVETPAGARLSIRALWNALSSSHSGPSRLFGGIRKAMMGQRARMSTIEVVDPHDVYQHVDICEPHDEQRRLLRAAADVLSAAGAGYAKLGACVLKDPPLQSPLFVIGPKLAPLMALAPQLRARRNRRPAAAVNVAHSQFERLVALFPRRPALATYCLAKALLLQEDRLLHLDSKIMAASKKELGSNA